MEEGQAINSCSFLLELSRLQHSSLCYTDEASLTVQGSVVKAITLHFVHRISGEKMINFVLPKVISAI